MLNVVKPLGPALKRVPERKSEVAILESFAAAMFAGRITWGWRNWPYEAHLAALWGGLAPAVLYDETVLRDGLGDVRVLILPGCDVLTEKVCRAILDFQEKGGIVVGDASLVPAVTPDITYAVLRDNAVSNRNDIAVAGAPYHIVCRAGRGNSRDKRFR